MPRPNRRASHAARAATIGLIAILAAAACGSAPAPVPTSAATTSASPPPEATLTPSPSPLPSPSAEASPSPSPSPAASASPEPSASLTPPPETEFWAVAENAIYLQGDRLRIAVGGPSVLELRYQKGASATYLDGQPIFVCRAGAAYDGQSGWRKVSGSWVCGGSALVSGFRTLGQPVDAWSSNLPLDSSVSESIALTAEGRWRWSYRGHNPVFGGTIRTEAVLDPLTGRFISASRTDPTGTTTYAFQYDAGFPEIVVP